MIDEKGRLFGKVNIVDLLIIIIVLAAAAFIGMKVLGPDSAAANTQDVRITMFCEESPTFVVDQLEAGCEAWDSANQVTLGKLIEWTTGDSMSAITDANGEVVEISREATAPCAWSARVRAWSATAASPSAACSTAWASPPASISATASSFWTSRA